MGKLYCIICLIGGLLLSVTAPAQSFLQQLERATPANRVIRLLNYFDTCQAVIKNQPYAGRLLTDIDALARRTRDDQLSRYTRFVRNTHAKHQQLDNAKNAALFLTVGERAEEEGDEQIAAVCRHFAGQYYFFNEAYGPAFEHLLAANRTFGQIGHDRIPEISRYLYELAFNYYYFQEYDKAITLLYQAARHPVFTPNMAIQTYNTLGMAFTVRRFGITNTDDTRKAVALFKKAMRVAYTYGDSLWVGIIAGNIANQYGYATDWQAALRDYRLSYNLIYRHGQLHERPADVAMRISNVFCHLNQFDSCRHYLDLSERLHQQNRMQALSTNLGDDYQRMQYYDVARQYHRAVDNLPLAYQYLDSVTTLRERINKRDNAKRVSLVAQKLQIQQHQAEVEAMKTEKKSEQTLFWIMGAVLLLLAGLFFRLYQLAQLKRRQEAAINAEREKTLRLEKQIVEDELERAKADLAMFMDKLHEKDKKADTQQNLTQASLLTKDDWDEFQRRFDRVYPGFLGQLKHQVTDITPAEERLMALSKLNINNRQMSWMLGISPESLRKSRYRLRKKVGIIGHSPLLDFLTEDLEVI